MSNNIDRITNKRVIRGGENGTFVYLTPDQPTVFAIKEWCEEMRVPKYVRPPYGLFHTTLFRTGLVIPAAKIKYAEPIVVTPDKFEFRVASSKNRTNRGLVLTFSDERIEERIAQLHNQNNTACYLKPHMVISYSIGNWAPKLHRPTFPLVFFGEDFSDNNETWSEEQQILHHRNTKSAYRQVRY